MSTNTELPALHIYLDKSAVQPVLYTSPRSLQPILGSEDKRSAVECSGTRRCLGSTIASNVGRPTVLAQRNRFPPELYDLILDYLWNDRETLNACSLVCHAWLPTTRLHLFRTAAFRSAEHFRRLERVLAEPVPSPRIAPFTQYVQCVTLSKPKQHMCSNLSWLAERLPRALGSLCNVRTLQLTHWDALDLGDRVVESLIAFFPRLTTLRFDEVGLAPRHYLRLLRAFPRLANVHVTGLTRCVLAGGMADPLEVEELRDRDSEVHLCREGSIKLRTLHLRHSEDCLLIAACLAQQPFQLCLHELSVDWRYVRARMVPYAVTLLRMSARTLERLRISFQSLAVDASALMASAFEPLRDSALTSLHVGRLELFPPYCRSGVEFDWVPALLSCVEPTRLHSVTFSVWVMSPEVDFLPWAAIDAQLGRLARARPGLRVTFEITRMSNMLPFHHEVKRAVMHRLPTLRAYLKDALEVVPMYQSRLSCHAVA